MGKIIRLTESDLARLVKRVIKEQFRGEFNRAKPSSMDRDSVDIDFESMEKNSVINQLSDIIDNFESINCDGINNVSAEELYGERPEHEIIYCTSYRGKSKKYMIDLLNRKTQ
jgi:hypothetical protein